MSNRQHGLHSDPQFRFLPLRQPETKEFEFVKDNILVSGIADIDTLVVQKYATFPQNVNFPLGVQVNEWKIHRDDIESDYGSLLFSHKKPDETFERILRLNKNESHMEIATIEAEIVFADVDADSANIRSFVSFEPNIVYGVGKKKDDLRYPYIEGRPTPDGGGDLFLGFAQPHSDTFVNNRKPPQENKSRPSITLSRAGDSVNVSPQIVLDNKSSSHADNASFVFKNNGMGVLTLEELGTSQKFMTFNAKDGTMQIHAKLVMG